MFGMVHPQEKTVAAPAAEVDRLLTSPPVAPQRQAESSAPCRSMPAGTASRPITSGRVLEPPPGIELLGADEVLQMYTIAAARASADAQAANYASMHAGHKLLARREAELAACTSPQPPAVVAPVCARGSSSFTAMKSRECPVSSFHPRGEWIGSTFHALTHLPGEHDGRPLFSPHEPFGRGSGLSSGRHSRASPRHPVPARVAPSHIASTSSAAAEPCFSSSWTTSTTATTFTTSSLGARWLPPGDSALDLLTDEALDGSSDPGPRVTLIKPMPLPACSAVLFSCTPSLGHLSEYTAQPAVVDGPARLDTPTPKVAQLGASHDGASACAWSPPLASPLQSPRPSPTHGRATLGSPCPSRLSMSLPSPAAARRSGVVPPAKMRSAVVVRPLSARAQIPRPKVADALGGRQSSMPVQAAAAISSQRAAPSWAPSNTTANRQCSQIFERDGGAFGCDLPAGHGGPHRHLPRGCRRKIGATASADTSKVAPAAALLPGTTVPVRSLSTGLACSSPMSERCDTPRPSPTREMLARKAASSVAEAPSAEPEGPSAEPEDGLEMALVSGLPSAEAVLASASASRSTVSWLDVLSDKKRPACAAEADGAMKEAEPVAVLNGASACQREFVDTVGTAMLEAIDTALPAKTDEKAPPDEADNMHVVAEQAVQDPSDVVDAHGGVLPSPATMLRPAASYARVEHVGQEQSLPSLAASDCLRQPHTSPASAEGSGGSAAMLQSGGEGNHHGGGVLNPLDAAQHGGDLPLPSQRAPANAASSNAPSNHASQTPTPYPSPMPAATPATRAPLSSCLLKELELMERERAQVAIGELGALFGPPASGVAKRGSRQPAAAAVASGAVAPVPSPAEDDAEAAGVSSIPSCRICRQARGVCRRLGHHGHLEEAATQEAAAKKAAAEKVAAEKVAAEKAAAEKEAAENAPAERAKVFYSAEEDAIIKRCVAELGASKAAWNALAVQLGRKPDTIRLRYSRLKPTESATAAAVPEPVSPLAPSVMGAEDILAMFDSNESPAAVLGQAPPLLAHATSPISDSAFGTSPALSEILRRGDVLDDASMLLRIGEELHELPNTAGALGASTAAAGPSMRLHFGDDDDDLHADGDELAAAVTNSEDRGEAASKKKRLSGKRPAVVRQTNRPPLPEPRLPGVYPSESQLELGPGWTLDVKHRTGGSNRGRGVHMTYISPDGVKFRSYKTAFYSVHGIYPTPSMSVSASRAATPPATPAASSRFWPGSAPSSQRKVARSVSPSPAPSPAPLPAPPQTAAKPMADKAAASPAEKMLAPCPSCDKAFPLSSGMGARLLHTQQCAPYAQPSLKRPRGPPCERILQGAINAQSAAAAGSFRERQLAKLLSDSPTWVGRASKKSKRMTAEAEEVDAEERAQEVVMAEAAEAVEAEEAEEEADGDEDEVAVDDAVKETGLAVSEEAVRRIKAAAAEETDPKVDPSRDGGGGGSRGGGSRGEP